MTSSDMELLLKYIDARLDKTEQSLKYYVDEKNQELKIYVDEKNSGLKSYIDEKNQELKNYVDEKNNELKSYSDKNYQELHATTQQLSKQIDIVNNNIFAVNYRIETLQHVIYYGFAFIALATSIIGMLAGFLRRDNTKGHEKFLTRDEIIALIDARLERLK